MGEMILYESSTVIHGRPSVLKGDMFINAFVHFRPPDWKFYSHDDYCVNSQLSEKSDDDTRYLIFENKVDFPVQVYKWMNADRAMAHGKVVEPGKEVAVPAQEDNEAFYFAKTESKYAVLSHFKTDEDANHYTLLQDKEKDVFHTSRKPLSPEDVEKIQKYKRRNIKLHNKSGKKMD